MIALFQQLRWAQGRCEPRSFDLACSVAPMLSRSRIWFSRGRPLLGLDVGRAIAAERGGSGTQQRLDQDSFSLLVVQTGLCSVQCSDASERYQRCLRCLLSTIYLNSKKKLLWECASGHQWETSLNHVKNHNTWCPACAGNACLSLTVARQHAASMGGQCLSTAYVNSREGLLWKCGAEHEWTATFAAVRNGKTWCPTCAKERIRKGLRAAQDIAAVRGGHCRSTAYKSMHFHLLWECRLGHTWQATLQSVERLGTRCPECAVQKRRLNLETAQEVAQQRSGECLSASYVNNATPLQWRCHAGHIWEATLNAVKDASSWCPTCRARRTERLMQMLF